MTKKPDAPAIRFKGFSDAWEQRKLGELALFNPKDELPQTFEYAEFNDRYNQRDVSARNNMRELVDSDANKVTKVFSTLFER